MKTTCTAWLLAGLLVLPWAATAQGNEAHWRPLNGASIAPAPAASWAASTERKPELGGSVAVVPAAATNPPAQVLPNVVLSPREVWEQEIARQFPQVASWQPGFLPDVAAAATAAPVPGAATLHRLSLAPASAGLPAGGAAAGQRLQVRQPGGELLVVAVAQPAAAGSHSLLVRGLPPGSSPQLYVVGLAHPRVLTIDYEQLAQLGLAATQALASQLSELRQELATLRRETADARQVNSDLLLAHAQLQQVRQQLNLLLSEQAAAASSGLRTRHTFNWLAD